MTPADRIRRALGWPARYLAGTIRRQLVLAVVVVHAILIVAFAADLGLRQLHALDEARAERAQSLAQMLAASSSSWVLSSDFSGLKEVIDSAASDRDLRYAMIIAPSGKVLAHTDARRRGLYLADPVGRSLQSGPPRYRVLSGSGDALDVAYPIIADGQTIGWAWVSLSRADVKRAALALIWEGGLFVLLAVFAGAVIAFAMASNLTGGLTALVRVVDRFHAGDRGVRVEHGRRDELGVVGEGLNAMLDGIEQSEEALKRALAEAEAASRAKSELLANMSHEIRTPLNGVVGLASALEATPLAPKQQNMAKTISASARTLEALLSEVLDSARLEAGAVTLHPEPLDLAELVRRIATLFSMNAGKKGVELVVEIDPDAEGLVEADGLRIEQILNNLLSNAVKFTEHGHVGVSLACEARDGVGGFALRVSDTGVGFEATAAEAIFQRFTQADGSITRRFGGTGLGLTISRRLAELMGGVLAADSVPGQGSIFSAWLPLPIDRSAAGQDRRGGRRRGRNRLSRDGCDRAGRGRTGGGRGPCPDRR